MKPSFAPSAASSGWHFEHIDQRVAGENRLRALPGEDRLGPAPGEEVAVLVGVAAALAADIEIEELTGLARRLADVAAAARPGLDATSVVLVDTNILTYLMIEGDRTAAVQKLFERDSGRQAPRRRAGVDSIVGRDPRLGNRVFGTGADPKFNGRGDRI